MAWDSTGGNSPASWLTTAVVAAVVALAVTGWLLLPVSRPVVGASAAVVILLRCWPAQRPRREPGPAEAEVSRAAWEAERQGWEADRQGWEADREQLEAAARLTQFTVDRARDSIFWIDRHGRITYANDAAYAVLGYRREELWQLPFREIDGEVDAALSRRRLQDARRNQLLFESAHVSKTGVLTPVEVSLHFIDCGGEQLWCWISRDITERKKASEYLGYQARHDELTGLPNRRLFESTLARELATATVEGAGLAVFFLDLDGLNLINNTLGHHCGDELLRHLAARLAGCLSEAATLARMGGDQFTVVVPRVQSEGPALDLARRLVHCLQESFPVEGHELLITASIGISLFPRDGRDTHGLLRCADSAMYTAKRQGKNQIQFFSPEMSAEARARLEMECLLRRALERHEFLLHFQPQLSLRTNQVVRYEALLRWDHPVLGMMAPEKFISIAEDTGLIEPIGRWVLEEACRQIRKTQLFTGREIGIAVNVSTPQLLRADFVATVLATLRKNELPAHLLELELTESIEVECVEEVARKMQQLRDLGVTFSIDDFGTGYSALSYLQRLPVHSVKIDRSFLRRVPADEQATAMLGAMVAMAHGMGLQVVLEGVEHADQLQAARGLGSDLVQGFYVARPAPLGTDLDMAAALHRLDQALTLEPDSAEAVKVHRSAES